MNRINNNYNINYIWENGFKYINKEQLEKLSEHEKFISCKCGKPREFRWKESSLTRHEGKGLYYGITPYKGRNNEELCHKCAFCAKCGKEGAYLTGGASCCKYEQTNDNPSGEWVLAYCSSECFSGVEKSSLPKKEPEKTAKCDHCGKLGEFNKVGNTFQGKSFCSESCYEAFGYWRSIHKGYNDNKCRIVGCSQKAYYECMDLCLSHSKPCKGGKIKPGGKACNAAMGVDEGDICEFCKDQTETYRSNPAAPAPQSITNENSENDDSVKVNPGNSPKPNPGKEELSEPKNNVKVIKFENNDDKIPANPASEKSPNQTDNETLIINLKSVKKITLSAEGNLVIEFKKESNLHSMPQTIFAEQLSQSQELQKVKNYLEKNNQTSLNQQELGKLFSGSDNKPALTKEPQGNNKILIGGALGGVLILGIGIGLLLKKKKVKKN